MSKNKYIQQIKGLFDKELEYYQNFIMMLKEENYYLKNTFVKICKIPIENELRDSTIDLRPILSSHMTNEEIIELANQIEPNLSQ